MSECNYRVWQWPRCRVLVCSGCSLNIAYKSRRQFREIKKTKSFLWCIRFWQHLDGDVTYNLSFCSVYSKCGNGHIFQSFPNSNQTVFNAYTYTCNFSCLNLSSKRKNVKPSAKSPNRTFTIGSWLINLLPLSPKPPYADFVGLQNMTLTLPWLVCRVISACCCDLVE